LWAGLSPNATSLILARAVHAVGAAIFIPGSLALMGACFTDSERGAAIGTWSSSSVLISVAGPVLGGWLADEFSWRWVFFINIPIASSRTAILLAAVVMGVMALAFFNTALDDQLADRGVPSSIVEQLEDERVKLAGAEIPGGMTEADTAIVQSAVDEGFVESFQRMM
jgi:MFS family permease